MPFRYDLSHLPLLDAMLCLTGDRFCLVALLPVLLNWVNRQWMEREYQWFDGRLVEFFRWTKADLSSQWQTFLEFKTCPILQEVLLTSRSDPSLCLLVTFPVDLTKTRLQIQGQIFDNSSQQLQYAQKKYTNMFQAAYRWVVWRSRMGYSNCPLCTFHCSIGQEEGVRKLYSG